MTALLASYPASVGLSQGLNSSGRLRGCPPVNALHYEGKCDHLLRLCDYGDSLVAHQQRYMSNRVSSGVGLGSHLSGCHVAGISAGGESLGLTAHRCDAKISIRPVP